MHTGDLLMSANVDLCSPSYKRHELSTSPSTQPHQHQPERSIVHSNQHDISESFDQEQAARPSPYRSAPSTTSASTQNIHYNDDITSSSPSGKHNSPLSLRAASIDLNRTYYSNHTGVASPTPQQTQSLPPLASYSTHHAPSVGDIASNSNLPHGHSNDPTSTATGINRLDDHGADDVVQPWLPVNVAEPSSASSSAAQQQYNFLDEPLPVQQHQQQSQQNSTYLPPLPAPAQGPEPFELPGSRYEYNPISMSYNNLQRQPSVSDYYGGTFPPRANPPSPPPRQESIGYGYYYGGAASAYQYPWQQPTMQTNSMPTPHPLTAQQQQQIQSSSTAIPQPYSSGYPHYQRRSSELSDSARSPLSTYSSSARLSISAAASQTGQQLPLPGPMMQPPVQYPPQFSHIPAQAPSLSMALPPPVRASSCSSASSSSQPPPPVAAAPPTPKRKLKTKVSAINLKARTKFTSPSYILDKRPPDSNGFVNYDYHDGSIIMSAVAPSGNSRRRERERNRRRQAASAGSNDGGASSSGTTSGGISKRLNKKQSMSRMRDDDDEEE